MKKSLLSLGLILAAFAGNAQTLTNGNFEAAMTQIPSFAYTYQTTGWMALINGGPETASPFEGSQAAKLVVTKDPALNAALGWGNDTITGIAQQTYKGAMPNAANAQVSFAYKFTKMGTDSAYVQIVIKDTMLVGTTDDVVLYYGYKEINQTVAAWTTANITMTATGLTGTPNRFLFEAVSSIHGYYDSKVPTVGTTLWLDGVQIGFAGVEENGNVASASVYPNPANNVLNISSTEDVASVRLMTTDGKVVATAVSSTSVNVADLNAGMYLYEITTVSGKVARGNFAKN